MSGWRRNIAGHRTLSAGLLALTLLCADRAEGQMAPASGQPIVFYAGIGRELVQYQVDFAAASLSRQATITLPFNLQYAWPHPSGRYLYAAWSNGIGADRHGITTFRIDSSTGALTPIGEPMPLRSRPVHLSVDVPGRHVLVAYNDPSGASVHRIGAEGTPAGEIEPAEPLEGGIYAHQIRVDPSNRRVHLVTRGNDPTATRAEEPGAIKIFAYDDGVLGNRATIAPNGGFGFQSRHLDFHPTQPWMYLGLERQNQIQLYGRSADGEIAVRPLFSKSTLTDPGNVRPGQMTGAIHVHPNGRFVYVTNRSSGTVEVEGRRIAIGGENSVAVFAIDPITGEPTLIQNADTRGFHPRTMAIDPTGRLLVAANMSSVPVVSGDSVVSVLASLSVFRIGADGKLAYERKYDIPPGVGTPFWVRFLALP